ncbi:MAG: cytochrome c-type biogenesis protein [Burkholderiaceae bacterium]
MSASSTNIPIDEDRYQSLAEELRCLVCQNQSLADSSAELAGDLRDEVREQMASGRSNAEIKDFLVARYGDFVLFRPPVKQTTWALWAGPFALLATGAGAWWLVQRRQRLGGPSGTAAPRPGGSAPARAGAEAGPEDAEREKARRLLD